MIGMYDTVSCYTRPPDRLSDSLFTAGTVSESFSKTSVMARLYRNPLDGVYEPRVTYWRKHGTRDIDDELGHYDAIDESDYDENWGAFLKVEFSIPKMCGGSPLQNITHDDAEEALSQVNSFLRTNIAPDLPDVRQWRVQRFDYCIMWDVSPHLNEYLGLFGSLQASGMTRHPFGASEGVVWKSRSTRGRWVKFYNKTKESGLSSADEYKHPQILRFEVSNYKDATRYMAKSWFDSDRTVGEFMRPGRALFTLASQWDKLGLSSPDDYDAGLATLMRRLSISYGHHWTTAYGILHAMQMFGAEAHTDLSLVSKSTYYRWRRRLVDDGFITVRNTVDEHGDVVLDGDVDVAPLPLPPLLLPLKQYLEWLPENLGLPKNMWARMSQKNSWNFLARTLGVITTRKNYTLMNLAEEIMNE